jgi:hypothetical protein
MNRGVGVMRDQGYHKKALRRKWNVILSTVVSFGPTLVLMWKCVSVPSDRCPGVFSIMDKVKFRRGGGKRCWCYERRRSKV